MSTEQPPMQYAVAHTGDDLDQWSRVRDYRVIENTIATTYWPNAENIARDFFWLNTQTDPLLAAIPPNHTYATHMADLALLILHPAYTRMRAFTQQDTALSALVAVSMTWHFARGSSLIDAMEATLIHVEEQMLAVQQALEIFTGGFVKPKAVSLKVKMALAQKLDGNAKIAHVMEIAGRLQKVAVTVQATRTPDVRESVRDITVGNHVPDVIAADMLGLAESSLETDFYRKYAQRGLLQVERDGTESLGRGPLIIVVDGSGSMKSQLGPLTREAWSKGMMLALLGIASQQKRDVCVLQFAAEGQLKQWHLKSGQPDVEQAADAAEFFFNGGDTYYDEWMREALKLITSSRYRKADVVVMGDGGSYMKLATVKEWTKARTERGMRAYGIQIGHDRFSSASDALTQLCDKVFEIDALVDESVITAEVFAI